MPKKVSLPSAASIRATFDYDPDTGILRWKRRKVRCGFERADNVFNASFAGRKVGCPNGTGYLRVLWAKRHYTVHRIIWKWWTGLDADDIDHADGDKSNNRISNLRECSRSQNNANSLGRKRKSEFRGVSKAGTAWQAYIRKDGEGIYLGRFKTPEDAHAAYCEAARQLHGSFARFD